MNNNWYNRIMAQPPRQYNNSNQMNPLQNNKKENQNELTLEEILEKADSLCKEHSGSRAVQNKYEECSPEDKDRIVEKLKKDIYTLSKDIFGNYAIQKIIDKEHYKIILGWNVEVR